MARTFTASVKASEVPPDNRAKILSEVPAPWYSAVRTKVPCIESVVTAS